MRRFNLRGIKADAGIGTLIETGTGTGTSVAWALRSGVESIHSVELEPVLHAQASERFANAPGVHLRLGESLSFLRETLPRVHGRKLVFLDAHFAGGADFGLSSYAASAADPASFPLLEELELLREALGSDDILIIDDARLYRSGQFQLGECPEFARRWDEMEKLEAALEYWSDTHVMVMLDHDHGYICLVPQASEGQIVSWLNIEPHDADAQRFNLQYEIPGVTSISILRRIHDARFATRYFVGDGIDVGGGIDSLALYSTLFPMMQRVFVYDQVHGDAQELANVADESFDFLYSSHCLEHLRDPRTALRNWLRVVKPAGHLVIQVPDEDLYEQGNWPSIFNSDHKTSFTVGKAESWSPVSNNLLDLARSLVADADTISINLLDHGYRRELQGQGIDQTRMPMAEAAIEWVLRKR